MINSLTGLGFDTAAFVKSIYPHLHQQSISSQDWVEELLSFVTEAFLLLSFMLCNRGRVCHCSVQRVHGNGLSDRLSADGFCFHSIVDQCRSRLHTPTPSLGRSFALLQLLHVKCPLSVNHKEDILLKRFSSKCKVLIYVFVNVSTKKA